MRVMVWFYNHRDALNPLMDEEEDEESDVEDEESDDDEDDEQDELETVKRIVRCCLMEIKL